MATIEVAGALTLEQLLAGEDARGDTADARTVSELADATGHDEKWIRRRLRGLLAEGRVEVVKVRRYRLDGQQYAAPAYRLVVTAGDPA